MIGSSATGQRHEVVAQHSYKQHINIHSRLQKCWDLFLSRYIGTFLPATAWLQSFFKRRLELPVRLPACQKQGQILLLGKNEDSSPGMEQLESIFPDFYSGDVFVYPIHPFAFAALLFRPTRAC